MPRRCERPACRGDAAVMWGMNPARRIVWLESSPPADGTLVNLLCARHADALVVPKGWSLEDRREPVPRLFAAPADDRPVDATPSRGVRRRRRTERGPSLFDAVYETLAETRAIPWSPTLVPAGDLRGLPRI
ncbi:MAG: hypothetical protein ACO26C_06600 [Ilumatobacteraceae bacterium]